MNLNQKKRSKVATKILWAPILKTFKGTEWIDWNCLGLTKSDSKAKLIENVPQKYERELLDKVRFAKVRVIEL